MVPPMGEGLSIWKLIVCAEAKTTGGCGEARETYVAPEGNR